MEFDGKTQGLKQKVQDYHSEIHNFIINHKVTKPLPRGQRINIIPPSLDQVNTNNVELSDEERDDIAVNLVQTFQELRNLEQEDVSSLLHDTVNFVTSLKEKDICTSMALTDKSSIDEVYEWLIRAGVSRETSQILKENEVDGFSLLHMEEKDVFAMLPTKVGPARKITVLLKEIQSAGKIKENQQKSSIEKETPPRPVPEIPLDEPGTSKTSNSNLETKNDCQGPQPVEMYVPAYSPLIVSLLASGEIMKEWDKFIEETAYHVLSVGNFESRGLYADFGRLMTTKYPCIGHKSLKEPWTFFNQKLSQKVRNIRWRWNARSKAPPVTDAKRMKRVQATVLDEDMNVDEAEKKLLQEFKKPVKMIDRALVAKAQRATFHVRRTFIERKHNGNCGDLIKKYPFLGIVEFIEKEFKLMKPDLQNYADRWLDVLQKLDELLGRSADEEDDRENDREIDVLNLLQNLEEKIKCQQKKGIKQPLITVCKKSDMTLKTKRDDPPRLLVVQDGQKNIMNCFIIGGGLEILCSTDLKKALTELLFCYYSWDLSYPKYFQILGFIQFYVLDDKENKFAKSFNYLKFTKEFDE